MKEYRTKRALWIESLNTVMDDNKALTLASNERIPLNPTIRLVFEISLLHTATPATSSRAAVLEKPLERKAGKNYGPPGTKKLINFVDDMNMPEVDTYGTVQPHILNVQHMDYHHWYDRSKLSLKEIHNVLYVSCMNPMAGSFTINPRLQGILFFTPDCLKTPQDPGKLPRMKLYLHESNRVYRDKVVDEKDFGVFDKIQTDLVKKFYQLSYQLHPESPRGNALLVGVGGSGKQRLTSLAASISSLAVFQITLKKGYSIPDLKTDLVSQYIKAGVKNIGTVFLMTDAQISDEKFLVLVNDLLASGKVDDLKAKLAAQEVALKQKNEDADKLIQVVGVETEKVSKEKAVADEAEQKVALIAKEVTKKRKDCKEDLAKAEPALLAAQDALNTLNKNNLTELKSFGLPVLAVTNVTAAVMVLLATGGKVSKD
ncbi:Dynein heavy chain 9, axonemal [Acipenser ruthenus]|uniref:Dynein heavy chain 9, axonemal n=1 Tax=Acipenser ruthenus TaxID=7906 RepID=A0A444U8J4_ACIRT|nr:Dynein heavy chain 9, axonemal [Acipenser ruthenus]